MRSEQFFQQYVAKDLLEYVEWGADYSSQICKGFDLMFCLLH